jgi:hypothetical protein
MHIDSYTYKYIHINTILTYTFMHANTYNIYIATMVAAVVSFKFYCCHPTHLYCSR